MPGYIVSYDLCPTKSDPKFSFLRQALLLGWTSSIKDTENNFNILPNRTLVGSFVDITSANNAFLEIFKHTSLLDFDITAEKYFLTAYSGGHVVSDEKQES